MPSASETYSGYLHADIPTPAEETELTRVGPRTPCGELMRCYWHQIPPAEDDAARVREVAAAVTAIHAEAERIGAEERGPYLERRLRALEQSYRER